MEIARIGGPVWSVTAKDRSLRLADRLSDVNNRALVDWGVKRELVQMET